MVTVPKVTPVGIVSITSAFVTALGPASVIFNVYEIAWPWLGVLLLTVFNKLRSAVFTITFTDEVLLAKTWSAGTEEKYFAELVIVVPLVLPFIFAVIYRFFTARSASGPTSHKPVEGS